MFTNPGYNGICCNLRPCAAAQKINEVKNMFLSVILTIAAAYMALQCGLTAFSVPFASWTWLSWLSLPMAAVMIGVRLVRARRPVRAHQNPSQQIQEEPDRARDKLHPQPPHPPGVRPGPGGSRRPGCPPGGRGLPGDTRHLDAGRAGGNPAGGVKKVGCHRAALFLCRI